MTSSFRDAIPTHTGPPAVRHPDALPPRVSGAETPPGPLPAGGAETTPLYLRAGGVAVVLDVRGTALPRVVHWGADLGELTPAQLTEVADAARPGVVSSTFDMPTEVTLVPLPSAGWPGRPGLVGDRDGAAWSPALVVTELTHVGEAGGGHEVVVTAHDPDAALRLTVRLRLEPSGVLRLRGGLTSLHARPYVVQALRLVLPVPAAAGEVLDLAGRHLHERSPQRHPLTVGMHERESRRGRPGLDGSLVFGAGAAGFGFGAGEVWTLHLGWSGNQHVYAERLPDGRAVLGAGETLLPGELSLGPDEEYATPWLYAVYGDGLDEVSRRMHAYLRARPGHPVSPRPVLLNTWEAVYFDHDPARLAELVEIAAEVGVERFVLDDGWLRGRRDDSAGLGDWFVDERRWPDGLWPLVRQVRDRGMSFGLWVEPEMVSLDSDLYRAHPDWVLAIGDRLPLAWRRQQVLDLTHPDAFGYLLARLDALVGEYAIDYLKWDHNRDVGEPGRQPRGEAVAHAQTLAVYRMIDTLRAGHPGLEIESCASGGGRVDLGILERTDRVWPSDCNDALERQSIQRWSQQLLPPELVGSHVGPPRAHSTGRTQDIAFRAGTALFGHFGIEWDLTGASPAERADLARWIELYKRLRPLLHGGRVVRGDHPDPALWVHGVVAPDGGAAVYALVAVATALTAPPGRVRLPGLVDDAAYRLAPLPPGDRPGGVNYLLPQWLSRGGCTLTGRALARAGVQIPDLHPQQVLLLRAERTA